MADISIRRKDLTASVAKKLEVPKQTCDLIIAEVFAEIGAGLKKKKAIVIHGFGSFLPQTRAARRGRNPKTGAAMKIKASKTVRFKPSQTLKSSLN